jgi:hypothetical protein
MVVKQRLGVLSKHNTSAVLSYSANEEATILKKASKYLPVDEAYIFSTWQSDIRGMSVS